MSKSKVYYDGNVRQRNMPAKRTKGNILMRREVYDHESYPQINVKIHDSFEPVIERVMREFHVSDQTARDAVQTAFEAHQEWFWDCWMHACPDIEHPMDEHFPGYGATVECQGRSGGHLVVKGLPPVREWNAIMVGRWWRFVDAVSQDIEYRISADALIECIEANDYATPIPLRCLAEVA